MRTRGVLLIFLCRYMIKYTYIDLLVIGSVTFSCARACARVVFSAHLLGGWLIIWICCRLQVSSLFVLCARAHAHTWCFLHISCCCVDVVSWGLSWASPGLLLGLSWAHLGPPGPLLGSPGLSWALSDPP